MKTALLNTLPALTLVCALSACGGGGGDDSASVNPGDGGGTQTYTVTASASAGGAISPANAVSVKSGTAATFTLTPGSGYSVSSVGGTCGGTLSGNTYTTKAITANCTVQATFAQTSAGTGSVAECFKMPTAVKKFEMQTTSSDSPGVTQTLQISREPVTFMGQAATKSTLDTQNGYSSTNYSAIMNNSSCTIAIQDSDLTEPIVYPTPECISFNIKPGDSFDSPGFTTPLPDGSGTYSVDPSHHTFIGFETITANGKTFPNACHFRTTSEGGADQNSWAAPEYGTVKSVIIQTDENGKTITETFEFSRDR